MVTTIPVYISSSNHNTKIQPVKGKQHKLKMLRLQLTNYSPITATKFAGEQARRSCHNILHLQILRLQLPARFLQFPVVRALKEEPDGRTAGQSWDPVLEVEVPFDQRPVNEYSSLKNSTLYSWGELSPGAFFLRLGGLCFVIFTVLGAPIAAASLSPSKDPVRFLLAAVTGTLLLSSLAVLRIYLGWSYVGDRLLSAVIPYEETGWYDGQMWVKPPEVLARDRLLGSYKVKPVIKLLKQTLLGTGVLLVTAVSLFIFASPVQNFMHSVFESTDFSSNLPASSKAKENIREKLLRLPMDVKNDDDLAAAAAEAADGRPVYCRDRFYRALAGGQYCKWDDLLN